MELLLSDTRFSTCASISSSRSSQLRSSSASSANLGFSSRNAVAVVGRPIPSSGSALGFGKGLCSLCAQPQQVKQGSRVVVGVADGTVALEAAPEEKTEVPEKDVVPIEKRYPAFPAILDINAIRDILPHRFPFLLVDRVIEFNPGVSAVAIKNVTINDNFFPGHFPERPIMPGVLMVEAMAQVAGIVLLNSEVGGSKDSFFFAGVDKVRFRKPVIAGDTLVMRMTLIKLQKRFGIAKLEGKAYVGGEVVCEGEFMLALGSSDQ